MLRVVGRLAGLLALASGLVWPVPVCAEVAHLSVDGEASYRSRSKPGKAWVALRAGLDFQLEVQRQGDTVLFLAEPLERLDVGRSSFKSSI